MAGFDFKSLTEKAKTLIGQVSDQVSDQYTKIMGKKGEENKSDPNPSGKNDTTKTQDKNRWR